MYSCVSSWTFCVFLHSFWNQIDVPKNWEPCFELGEQKEQEELADRQGGPLFDPHANYLRYFQGTRQHHENLGYIRYILVRPPSTSYSDSHALRPAQLLVTGSAYSDAKNDLFEGIRFLRRGPIVPCFTLDNQELLYENTPPTGFCPR